MGNEKRKLRSSSSQNSEAKKSKLSKQSEEKQPSKIKTGFKKTRVNGPKLIPIQGTSKCCVEQDDCTILKGTGRPCVNHIQFLNQFQRGFGKLSVLEQIAEQIYTRDLRWFTISTQVSTPDLRVTAMQWHPHIPNLLVSGGKAGTLQLYDTKDLSLLNEPKRFIGIGPGCTIEAVRFNTKSCGTEVCTASVDGTVSTYNFDKDLRSIKVESECSFSVWFCSVDVHSDGKAVYAGDNKGKLAIHYLDSGKTSYDLSIHKAKIKHLELHPR
ncbi:DNA damage-binding protein 2 [Homalodisca vitripennis]|nr:DNA damage-binding protein 2 [Homalodisca vitripennis]